MTLGGLLYDPSWWNRMVPESLQLPVELAHRLPLVRGVPAGARVFVDRAALRGNRAAWRSRGRTLSLRRSRLTLRTAVKAFTTRSIAIVLLGGLLIDSVTRNFATLTSEYYRLIGVPGWAFGFIGSLIAVGNWFIPGIAETGEPALHSDRQPRARWWRGGRWRLFLLAPAWPWVGLLPAMCLMMMLGFVSFTISRFLHGVAESDQRATLLSVKGLVFNLGYGAYSLGVLAAARRPRETGVRTVSARAVLAGRVFRGGAAGVCRSIPLETGRESEAAREIARYAEFPAEMFCAAVAVSAT